MKKSPKKATRTPIDKIVQRKPKAPPMKYYKIFHYGPHYHSVEKRPANYTWRDNVRICPAPNEREALLSLKDYVSKNMPNYEIAGVNEVTEVSKKVFDAQENWRADLTAQLQKIEEYNKILGIVPRVAPGRRDEQNKKTWAEKFWRWLKKFLNND